MTEHLPFHKTPISYIQGIRRQQEKRLMRIGITTIQDLLFHLPTRYEDRTRASKISSLHPGDQAIVDVEVQCEEVRGGKRRSYLLVSVTDGSGTLILRFFTFTAFHRENFRPGARLRCYGEVRQGSDCLELVHPEWRRIDVTQTNVIDDSFTPIYSSTEGLHQITWRTMIKQALEMLEADPKRIPELLPIEFSITLALPTLLSAIRLLHSPPHQTDITAIIEGRHPALRRLAFEELIAHQIGLRRLRLEHKSVKAPILNNDNVALRQQFLEQLPFGLTTAQQRVVAEISKDLAADQPMLRLLQGDVGSGKTVVAIIAALQALEAGYQVAFMAPTELLAEQHLHSIRTWLVPFGLEVAWLKRQRDKERERILDALAVGRVILVVGTHALIQADVTFSALGLIIIDEQQRFGVHQRLALREKGTTSGMVPHQLIMTATPIPRSLAMTAYADLDLSILDELPPGRNPVATAVIPDTRRDEVIERVRVACAAGRQVYWICTLIEESDTLQYQAAENTAVLLQSILDGVKIGLVHGRMKAIDREAVMAAFKAGSLSVLVATTVVEVGVDVPNASVIIIENPERLGLAQLHQLRGRVGRGNTDSHCLLMYHPPLSAQAFERLRIIRTSTDGFEIARQDLQMRGPGEFLGTKQAGELQFKVVNLLQQQDLVTPAQKAADRLLESSPYLAKDLEDRWLVAQQSTGSLT